MRNLSLALTIAAAALSATTLAARADHIVALPTAGHCPAGSHLGYEDKYCWSNDYHACPAGFHLGYEDKYCWRNRN